MTDFVRCAKLAAALAATIVFTGCAIGMKVPLKDPAVATNAYAKSGSVAPASLSLKDERADAQKTQPVTGRIPMSLVEGDKPFDAAPWLARNIARELTARGLPVTAAVGGNGTPVVLKDLRIDNHRATGFSPFVTFTFVRADVVTPRGTERVTSFFRRAKVPVMSFDEVIEPTYNDQFGIVTKELAAKINQALFRQAYADATVDAIVAKVNKDAANASYWDVLELGFGNNRRAVPELVKLAAHSNEYVRLAAISSIGILKAQDQHDFLVKLVETAATDWQDRAMALKALGDLGTPKARAFLEQQRKALEGKTDKESGWSREVIGLYL